MFTQIVQSEAFSMHPRRKPYEGKEICHDYDDNILWVLER